MIRAALLIVLSLLAGTALGAADADTPPWYDVEVIVFKNNTPPASNGEVWPVDPGSPELEKAMELVPLPQSSPLPGNVQPFQELGDSNHTLASALARLYAARDYHPLLHLAWRQPVTAQADAPAVHIYSEDTSDGTKAIESTDAPPPREFDGTVRVSRNRFLHIDMDLLLRESGTAFRLRQSRRVNSGEVHYFDHPAFGALIKLTPHEAPGQKKSGPAP
ncbi:MAG: peptidoglycan binding protein CsiV [Gammaproteobacteria bacterium]|nr:peptidoglycan binding protein CsiV [Gammaproteobacteria bacterium]